MRKKVILIGIILLLFVLYLCGISGLFGPKLETSIFVKSFIYSEEMDLDVNYIAPKNFYKSVETVQISNSPKGVDCAVYGDTQEVEGNYTVGTVRMGVNCADWSEDTGIGENLEINEVVVTWSDGSQTTEEIGQITIVAPDKQCNNYMNSNHNGDVHKATYLLSNDTEITGLAFPSEEALGILKKITINEIPLEDISKDRPLKLKKNELCTVQYQVNDDREYQYGTIRIKGFLMGMHGGSEEKIANFTFGKPFTFDKKFVEN